MNSLNQSTIQTLRLAHASLADCLAMIHAIDASQLELVRSGSGGGFPTAVQIALEAIQLLLPSSESEASKPSVPSWGDAMLEARALSDLATNAIRLVVDAAFDCGDHRPDDDQEYASVLAASEKAEDNLRRLFALALVANTRDAEDSFGRFVNLLDPVMFARRYKATWGADFRDPGTRIVGADFFRRRGGYSDLDISRVLNMRVGEKWMAPDYRDTHTVERLPDSSMPIDSNMVGA
ncbi:hypothetical protein [Burkholderia sp. MBR-1]|uniref:hypothetical protein n=1 Tax=Burkholderia sp. MBR-1 TaxID=2732364 RepID=UPI0015EED8AA|nr:hypothetical protein [Burkholderia sp. MBR-1]QMI49801.1 hypothetical protein MBR110_30490 [Burkholderia sp. MBR-1]